MRTHWRAGFRYVISRLAVALVAGCNRTDDAAAPTTETGSSESLSRSRDHELEGEHGGQAKALYVWAGDQALIAADFLAVIDFDRHSKDHGKVLGRSNS